MSIHIGASEGDIADTVLMPGDPLRAEFVAQEFLDDVVQYNNIRGMLGFTGTYRGRRISVQGSGMGMPSLAIYVNELVRFYGVKRLVRIGSCGALQEEIRLRDLVLAMTASTDSGMNRLRFHGMDYAPAAGWKLFRSAVSVLESRGAGYHAGGVLSSDAFYTDDPEQWRLWAAHGVLAVEMETNQLYSLAARLGVEALTVLTVSDSLVSEENLTPDERQSGFHEMVETALETVVTAEQATPEKG